MMTRNKRLKIQTKRLAVIGMLFSLAQTLWLFLSIQGIKKKL